MNTKTIVSGVLTAVFTFLLGWLIFGILLMNYYNSHMSVFPGLLKKQPDLIFIGLANIAWGLMLAYVFSLADIKTVSKGFMVGLIIFGLVAAGINCMFQAQYHLYARRIYAIDTVANAVLGALAGAFLGWWNGRK